MQGQSPLLGVREAEPSETLLGRFDIIQGMHKLKKV